MPNKSPSVKRNELTLLRREGVYPKQFFLLAFMCTVTFKCVLLPRFLVASGGRTSYLSMAILIGAELAMLAVVYKICTCGGLLKAKLPAPLRALAVVSVGAGCALRLVSMLGETCIYVSTALFDDSQWGFILLALMPVLMFFAYKGGNVVARASEILFWVIAVAAAFMIMFARVIGDAGNLLPLSLSPVIAAAGDAHLMWFGDLAPLLFLDVSPSKEKSGRVWPGVAAAAVFLAPVALMLVFISIYGRAGALVPNAFSRIAAFNKLSFILGTLDLPTVCAWLFMAIIDLSVSLYGIVEAVNYFVRGHRLAVSAICAAAVGAAVFWGVGNAQKAYAFATGAVRYVSAAICYGLPAIIYLTLRFTGNDNPSAAGEACRQAFDEHANSGAESPTVNEAEK